jgi:hypothetical protein
VGFVLGPGYASSFALSRRDVSSGSYTAGLRRQRIGNGRVGRFEYGLHVCRADCWTPRGENRGRLAV